MSDEPITVDEIVQYSFLAVIHRSLNEFALRAMIEQYGKQREAEGFEQGFQAGRNAERNGE